MSAFPGWEGGLVSQVFAFQAWRPKVTALSKNLGLAAMPVLSAQGGRDKKMLGLSG